MRLIKFHLRYHPPGISLEYIQSGVIKLKTLDFFNLTIHSDIDSIANDTCKTEELITEDVVCQFKQCLTKLKKRLEDENVAGRHFYIYKTLKGHLLPLTNVAFDKNGKRCLTGSYDRTCKIWNIESGTEELSLIGHKNVVFSVGYNYPKCDKIITGSFDKTAKVWESETGNCVATLYGHEAEIVTTGFSLDGELIATASMDHSAKLYHSATGQEIMSLLGHNAEIIALNFNTVTGQQLITGSFDGTISIWDIRDKDRVGVLSGHMGEISNCKYNFDCQMISSSSLDKTARLWDVRSRRCLSVLEGHTDEVLDVDFDWCCRRLATAAADGSAKIFDLKTDFREEFSLQGHTDEISKVCFSPGGGYLITASADSTARLWDTNTGKCTQVLSGHRGEVFSCAFSYFGDTLVTASKDNTCRVWK